MSWISALLIQLLQTSAKPVVSMVEHMRSDGRIYVVIAVMLTILTGIVLYLFRLDRKLSQLEKLDR